MKGSGCQGAKVEILLEETDIGLSPEEANRAKRIANTIGSSPKAGTKRVSGTLRRTVPTRKGKATAPIPQEKLSKLNAAAARPGLLSATPRLEAAIASAMPRPQRKIPATPTCQEASMKISRPEHKISMAAQQTRLKPHL